jgi:hypothetical protein
LYHHGREPVPPEGSASPGVRHILYVPLCALRLGSDVDFGFLVWECRAWFLGDNTLQPPTLGDLQFVIMLTNRDRDLVPNADCLGTYIERTSFMFHW